MSKERLKKLLKYDALSHAEKLTGKSYKLDKATEAIGVMLHIQKGQATCEELKKYNDTHFGSTLQEYLAIAKDCGFEIILKEDFYSPSSERQESLYILFNYQLSILLCFDTFYGDSMNGGSFYYNWKPNTKKISLGTALSDGLLSSGHFHKKNIWIGHHDCRVGLRFYIDQLKENGEFITNWVEAPFLWLVHHEETKGEYDYEKLNKTRIAQFPKDIQKRIKGKKS